MKNLFRDIDVLLRDAELSDEITIICKKHLLIELNRIKNEENK